MLAEICAVVPGPVSAEVAATEFEGMMAEAGCCAAIAHEHRGEGAADAGRAARLPAPDPRGAMVNVTLCFSAAQAMLAAKAGATFISPFIGRLDDIGRGRHGS